MTDEPIESRPGFPVGAFIWLLIAFALGILSLVLVANKTKDAEIPALLAALPLCIGLGLLLARPAPFAARFTATHVEVYRPQGMEIPYDSLQGLWAKGRSSDPRKPGPHSFFINVMHQEGVLGIPARLNVPSDAVYLHLFKQFPPEGAGGVHGKLQEHLEEQLTTFGQEKVFAYRARAHLGFGGLYRGFRAGSLGLLAAGMIWIVAGIVMKKEPLWGCGIFVAFLGLIFFLAFLATSRGPQRIKKWRNASLVISPLGLALSQGDLLGEMRWEELRDVNFKSRYKTFQYDSSGGNIPSLILKFEGANLTIPDIYDQPLWVIFQRIRNYWK